MLEARLIYFRQCTLARVRTAGGNAPFAMCKWLSEEKKLPDVYLAFDFG